MNMREKTEINPLGAGRRKKIGKKVNFIFGTDTLEIINSKKKGTRTKFVEESIKKNERFNYFCEKPFTLINPFKLSVDSPNEKLDIK